MSEAAAAACPPLRREPRIHTIAAETCFVDALADGVLARCGADPVALSGYRILVPTRRACRALIEAFLRRSGGRPLLLPAISPIGDLDEDEMALATADSDDAGGDLGIPPALSDLRRQLLLSRLILSQPGTDATPEQAAHLAAELARLIDQVHTEGLDFSRLTGLVPDQLSQHWQATLRFLSIVTEAWPAILDETGCIDAADRRNQILRAQGERWTRSPPATPVLAAGSTGSLPATADLLAVIARLPEGAVVLPGLDVDADDETWAALTPSHPQFAMARLLERMKVDRRLVTPWQDGQSTERGSARTALINRALRPAAVAERARDAPPPAGGLDGVGRIDAPGPEEEARAVALIMRWTLERPDRTAALVTADRDLARRVAAELERWGIAIDDSAGRPLDRAMPGTFLRLTAAMVAEDFAPVPLLAALKHPLAGGGLAPPVFRSRVRALERMALRGPRPAPGMSGLREAASGDDGPAVADLLDRLAAATDGLASLLSAPQAPLGDLLAAHVAAAEALAATDREEGASRLWAGGDGEATAAFVAELSEAGDDYPAIRTGDFPGAYPALFTALMAGRVVRPRFGRHPRLAIWGPLEARLQRADVMILGGLNEGSWPPEARASPWMSRPMMREFGLPLPERRVGLSAHDFVQGFAAPEVWLTRAERVEGTPTVASRWLMRLDNLTEGTPLAAALSRKTPWLAWQGCLDAPAATQRTAPPAPCPPVAARPRRLSVTEIETWMRDPYAIYARRILRLKALDPLDADPGAADYGSVIHRALDAFLSETPRPWPEDSLERLLACGRRAFGNLVQRVGLEAFWWPRFQRVARWFVDTLHEVEPPTATATEVAGRLAVEVPYAPFELTARADRIDTLADGGLVVIDYKTGYVPTQKDIQAGFSPQLPLEAAIAAAGGFAGIDPGRPVRRLEFWRLAGGDPPGEIRPVTGDKDPTMLAADALQGLGLLIDTFDCADTPYLARPRPANAPKFSDYEHLARVREWSAGGGDEDGQP